MRWKEEKTEEIYFHSDTFGFRVNEHKIEKEIIIEKKVPLPFCILNGVSCVSGEALTAY